MSLSRKPHLSYDKFNQLYSWIDKIPLSRPKRNISRDFSDGVLMAELLKHFYPRLVELHNYAPANSKHQKIDNWNTLNRKVLGKVLPSNLARRRIESLASATPGTIEQLLLDVKLQVEKNRKYEDDQLSNYTSSDVEPLSPVSGEETGPNNLACHIRRRRLGEGVFLANRSTRVRLETKITKLRKEIAEKSENIDRLNNKVSHLDSLIILKDQRIRDLTAQLDRFRINEAHAPKRN